MSVQRWKIIIEYDGQPFCGWQMQDNVLTVQQVLEEAIHKFCQQDIRLHAAGRTDAGVHARGQVAHFDLDYGDRIITGHDLTKAINAHARDYPVSVISAEKVAPDFHARFMATNKLYTYRILNRSAPPAIEMNRVWHVKRKLDETLMQQAANSLIGYHDFTTFRATECQAKSPLRSIDRAIVERQGDELLFHFEGRSFLHHQVRNMVGTLAMVGEGKWQVDDVAKALAAKDRVQGGPTAPPEGLYLVRIDYP